MIDKKVILIDGFSPCTLMIEHVVDVMSNKPISSSGSI